MCVLVQCRYVWVCYGERGVCFSVWVYVCVLCMGLCCECVCLCVLRVCVVVWIVLCTIEKIYLKTKVILLCFEFVQTFWHETVLQICKYSNFLADAVKYNCLAASHVLNVQKYSLSIQCTHYSYVKIQGLRHP